MARQVPDPGGAPTAEGGDADPPPTEGGDADPPPTEGGDADPPPPEDDEGAVAAAPDPPPSLAAKITSLLTVVGYMCDYKWPFVVAGAAGLVLEALAAVGVAGARAAHDARLGAGTVWDSYGNPGVVDTVSDGKRLLIYLFVSLVASHMLRDPTNVTWADKFLAGMGHWAVGRAVCGFTFWGCLPLILWDGYYYGRGRQMPARGTVDAKADGKAD